MALGSTPPAAGARRRISTTTRGRSWRRSRSTAARPRPRPTWVGPEPGAEPSCSGPGDSSFSRPVAVIASGEMAVAYFWMHVGGSGKLWWWLNRGEVVILYAFIWLLFAAWGAGPFSLDARWRLRGGSGEPRPA